MTVPAEISFNDAVDQIANRLDDDLNTIAPGETPGGVDPEVDAASGEPRDPKTGELLKQEAPALEPGLDQRKAAEKEGDQDPDEVKADESEEGAEADEAQAGDDSEITTLADLAKSFEQEEEIFLGAILVDEEKEISLADLVKNHRDGHTVDAIELDDRVVSRSKALDEQIAENAQASSRKLSELATILDANMRVLEGKQRSPEEWAALKDQNPDLYLAEKMDLHERQQSIQSGIAHLQDQQTQQEAAAREAMQEWTKTERTSLRKAMKWETDSSEEQGMRELRAYLGLKYGMQPGELDQIQDHRSWLVTEKARRYDELKEKAVPAAKQKLEAKPRASLRKSARRAQGSLSTERLNSAKAKVAKTGDVRDAAAAIELMDL